MSDRAPLRRAHIFTSDLEAGMRALVLLLEDFPRTSDLDRLLMLDYFLVHSGDIQEGPPSLHPATPQRTGEVTARRALLERGARLMVSRDLIELIFNENGFEYRASEHAPSFVRCLRSPYSRLLRERARWVTSRFRNCTGDDIAEVFRGGLNRWGTELSMESPEYEVLE